MLHFTLIFQMDFHLDSLLNLPNVTVLTTYQIDSRSITNADQLQLEIANSRIGQRLNLKIQRGDRIEEVAIRPGELENAASF
jgi:hypothetical protein